MQAAGLAVDPALVREVGVQRRTAYAAMAELLAHPTPPTAIVVDNNQAGVGVVRAILEAGLRLARDCSLIVYDGLPEDTLFDIANVTAIEQPTPDKVGRRLADLMLGVLHGTVFERLQTEWQPVLCAGNSDGPAPG
jgi:LacI family transcriptional regulator